MPPLANSADSATIVAVEQFILATRDSGYRGTQSALAELVDNSLQAGAARVVIDIQRHEALQPWPLTVTVTDDGGGMGHRQLRQALRFGGSDRFNDRSGLGRFGMGLPNASLSRARRVEVRTWRPGAGALWSYLDVDEIARRELTAVPRPALCPVPDVAWSTSGTSISWTRCDRLEYKRPGTIARRVADHLGRVFRYFLLDGIEIVINGAPVLPRDPLFLDQRTAHCGARPFGDPLRYEVATLGDAATEEIIGFVEVRFSELPVQDWHHLSNAEKRARGISKGAGVSVVRAGREIDHGWFFMGQKRKENYDDWWRCEVRFDPELDDLFGITHTKQQIRPSPQLLEVLTRDMEAAARALNARARRAHEVAKVRRRLAVAERRASAQEDRLTPLTPRPLSRQDHEDLERLSRRFPGLLDDREGVRYRLVFDAIPGTRLFDAYALEELLLVVLNSQHPFFTKIYQPLLERAGTEDERLRTKLDLLILGLARAEAAAPDEAEASGHLTQRWSEILTEFLKDEPGA